MSPRGAAAALIVALLVAAAATLHYTLLSGMHTLPITGPFTSTSTPLIQSPMNTSTTFTLTSPAFTADGSIPLKYTCDGAGISPALEWSSVPRGAQSLALIVEDPDVPKAVKPDGLFVHWVLYAIRPETTSVTEGAAPGAAGASGINGAGKEGYVPPCPPKQYEPAEHRYIFTLYALDILPTFEQPPTKDELVTAMQGHILGEASLTGRYKRP